MTIAQIYDQLGITPNLQAHMLRVTSVALFIAQYWKGNELDPDLLTSYFEIDVEFLRFLCGQSTLQSWLQVVVVSNQAGLNRLQV